MTISEKLKILAEIDDTRAETNPWLDALLGENLNSALQYLHKQYVERVQRYRNDLQQFEQRFGMTSAGFYQQFQQGQLGDAMDFFEWAGLYELWQISNQKMLRIRQAL